jgi:hypothetical protein
VDSDPIPVENCPQPVYRPWDSAVDKPFITLDDRL